MLMILDLRICSFADLHILFYLCTLVAWKLKLLFWRSWNWYTYIHTHGILTASQLNTYILTALLSLAKDLYKICGLLQFVLLILGRGWGWGEG